MYKEYKKAETHVNDALGDAGGLISVTRDEIAAIHAASDQITARVRARKTVYEDAVDEYKDHIASQADAPATDLLQKVGEKLDELAEPIEVTSELAKGADATALTDLKFHGTVVALEERLDQVTSLLGEFVATSGEAPKLDALSKEARLNLAMLKTAPAFADELAEALSYPHPSALLLESEHLRIQLEYARSRFARADARLQLLRQRQQSYIEELSTLHLAYESLEPLGVTEGDKSVSIYTAYKSDEADWQEAVVAGLLHYANSWTLHRVLQEELDYMLIALDHKAALDASRLAFAQWANLIGVPLAQLKSLFASGIKPEHIGNILQAAGFTAIGIGVN